LLKRPPGVITHGWPSPITSYDTDRPATVVIAMGQILTSTSMSNNGTVALDDAPGDGPRRSDQPVCLPVRPE
jgi:hypothetical protein